MEISAHAFPFRHWVAAGLPPEFRLGGPLLRLAENLPPPAHPGWVRYDNDCERLKRSCRDLELLGADAGRVFAALHSDPFVGWLRRLTGLPGLQPDPELHGAGVHVLEPSGYLQPHLDYALHPGGLERRLSLVVFLNHHWNELHGGSLDFYLPDGETVAERVYPRYGRVALWEAGELSYHGVSRVSWLADTRRTLACYYLAEPRPGASRRRALFVPRRAE